MSTAGGGSTPSWDLRARAESFGAVAEEYDAVRARYPTEIVRAVVAGEPVSPPAAAGGPVRVLDVGTGTGILARALVERGAEVVGADLDPAMAEVARRSGLTVHVGPFEALELPERFDRITVAQAWHWIDPEQGVAAARRLLSPGGQLWLLWNVGEAEPAVKAVTDSVYAGFEGELAGLAEGGISRGVSGRAADLAAERFRATPGVRVRTLAVPWRAELPTARWVRLVATFSDHATLPPELRARLLAALTTAVDAAGGVVAIDYVTHAVVVSGLAGRAAPPRALARSLDRSSRSNRSRSPGDAAGAGTV